MGEPGGEGKHTKKGAKERKESRTPPELRQQVAAGEAPAPESAASSRASSPVPNPLRHPPPLKSHSEEPEQAEEGGPSSAGAPQHARSDSSEELRDEEMGTQEARIVLTPGQL